MLCLYLKCMPFTFFRTNTDRFIYKISLYFLSCKPINFFWENKSLKSLKSYNSLRANRKDLRRIFSLQNSGKGNESESQISRTLLFFQYIMYGIYHISKWDMLLFKKLRSHFYFKYNDEGKYTELRLPFKKYYKITDPWKVPLEMNKCS